MTPKQSAFIDEYLVDFNATQAAIRAGYSEKTAYSIGHENLSKPEIKEGISAKVAERAMDKDEALIRLAEQARSDYSEYIDENGKIDLLKMKDDGKLHLVKGIRETKDAQTIEFHDSQSALFKIIDIHGMTKQIHEISGPDQGDIPIHFVDYRTPLGDTTKTEGGPETDSASSG